MFYLISLQVGGRIIPGPLFDFGIHMFHNSKLMMKEGNGPFFYLPKVCICKPRKFLLIIWWPTRVALMISVKWFLADYYLNTF